MPIKINGKVIENIDLTRSENQDKIIAKLKKIKPITEFEIGKMTDIEPIKHDNIVMFRQREAIFLDTSISKEIKYIGSYDFDNCIFLRIYTGSGKNYFAHIDEFTNLNCREVISYFEHENNLLIDLVGGNTINDKAAKTSKDNIIKIIKFLLEIEEYRNINLELHKACILDSNQFNPSAEEAKDIIKSHYRKQDANNEYDLDNLLKDIYPDKRNYYVHFALSISHDKYFHLHEKKIEPCYLNMQFYDERKLRIYLGQFNKEVSLLMIYNNKYLDEIYSFVEPFLVCYNSKNLERKKWDAILAMLYNIDESRLLQQSYKDQFDNVWNRIKPGRENADRIIDILRNINSKISESCTNTRIKYL